MRRRAIVPLLVVAALALTACGDDDTTDVGADASTTSSAPTAFPVTVTAANGEITIDEQPSRIVSLSPTATEMLFAIGAGDQVVAVDEFSTFPPEAPITDLSGYQANVEAIAGYDPDLVVMQSDDIGDELAAIDVPLVVAPAAAVLDDSYEQLELLGLVTGHVDAARAVADDMRAEIDELVASVPDTDEPLTYYYELDTEYFSVTSSTFIGALFSMAGFENIADAADDGTSGGYPQLSVEYIVDADPDVIFLADTKCCNQTAETVADRAGWSTMTAVRAGRIVELDDDIASRWGPRVVDLLEQIVTATTAATGADPY
ncbi:MAG TPA: ABC transporter substrate-binding protein [Acidimicrobiia bacterium]|nr:ABC transporter substrate-binding protein [Acidimicrobiia bacterium]